MNPSDTLRATSSEQVYSGSPFILMRTTGWEAVSLWPKWGSWSSTRLFNLFRITQQVNCTVAWGSQGVRFQENTAIPVKSLCAHLWLLEVLIQSHLWSLFVFNLMLIDLGLLLFSCRNCFLLTFLSVPFCPSNKEPVCGFKINPMVICWKNQSNDFFFMSSVFKMLHSPDVGYIVIHFWKSEK